MFVRIFITCTTKCLIGYKVPEDRDVVEVAADGLFFSFFNTVSVTYSLRMLFPSVPYSPKLPPEHIYTPSLHPIRKFEIRATTSPFRGGGTKASSILSMGVRHPQSLWHPPRGQLQGEEQVPLPLPFVHHALSPRITPKFVDDDDKASLKICRWRRQSLTIRNGSKLVFLGLVGLRYGIEREWIQKKEMNDDKIVTFITCLVQAKGTKNE